MTGAPARLPLPALLSQALIAFTIECDNEFEHRMPHTTTVRPAHGPWLISMAMWANFLRLVPADGVPLREVDASARITNLAGLERWGYLRIGADRIVRPTPAGIVAQRIWQPLAGEVEQRWRERHGDPAVDRLRAVLTPGASARLPRYLPVMAYADGMRSDRVPDLPGAPAEDLSALLAQNLLAYTLEYERHTRLSLPLNADVVRVLGTQGVPVRELPRRSGVSKEAIAAALGFLARRELVHLDSAPESRGKIARLTARGVAVQGKHAALLDTMERRWPAADQLRAALVTGDALASGVRPYPDGWRAQPPYLAQTAAVLADPAGALPHQPMVLHRGGYPDGS